MIKNLLIFFFLLTIFLAACGGGTTGDPAVIVENYLQAKAGSDADTIRGLLCADMEALAEREIRTFESVTGVQLEGMDCQQVGDSLIVSCDGKFVATYGAEVTDFPLSSYRVVEEDGEWKWCGEGQ